MAPAERGALMALTASIARERTLTVLFTEHDMDVVFTVAERVMVLHQGRVIAEGAPDTVRADPEVQAVYLGGAAWGAPRCGAAPSPPARTPRPPHRWRSRSSAWPSAPPPPPPT